MEDDLKMMKTDPRAMEDDHWEGRMITSMLNLPPRPVPRQCYTVIMLTPESRYRLPPVSMAITGHNNDRLPALHD